MLNHKSQVIAFAALLRTRAVHQFGIRHSSWTLYQPHALVWDYNFWGGRDAFASACKLITGKIPCLCWERIIPPPFLDAWKSFLHLPQRKDTQAKDFDPLIGPLLPLFSCGAYNLPLRVLKEEEVMNLSGLGNCWSNTDIKDAEKLPESLIRDMCGNSFHHALISSALGNNTTLRRWIDGTVHGPSVLVAGQHQALATYTELCELIQKEIEKNKSRKRLQVVKDLPYYPVVEKYERAKLIPKVAPATVCGVRTAEITKQDQRKEHCIEAALFELDQKTCLLFNQYGISQYFESLRACLRSPLSFAEYTRLIIGSSLAKHSVPAFCAQLPNKPVTRDLQRLQEAFVTWERDRNLCSLLSCLLDATLLKEKSSWAVGSYQEESRSIPFLHWKCKTKAPSSY